MRFIVCGDRIRHTALAKHADDLSFKVRQQGFRVDKSIGAAFVLFVTMPMVMFRRPRLKAGTFGRNRVRVIKTKQTVALWIV